MNQLVPVLAPNEDVQHVGTARGDRRCRSEITPKIDPTTPFTPVEEAMDQLVAMLAPNNTSSSCGHAPAVTVGPGSEVPTQIDPATPSAPVEETVNQLVPVLAPNEDVQHVGPPEVTAGAEARSPPRLINHSMVPPSRKRWTRARRAVLAPNKHVQLVRTAGGHRRPGSEVPTQIDPATPSAPVEETVNQLVAVLPPNEHVERMRTIRRDRRPSRFVRGPLDRHVVDLDAYDEPSRDG